MFKFFSKSAMSGPTSRATFAAGCFWGVESTFLKVKGVKETMVGYTGGATLNPTYKQVCADVTGHAEAIQIDYDPAQVSYGDLLNIFWNSHDPTTLNRQGPDMGSQYRSAIFYHSDEQKAEAEASVQQAQKMFKRPIVTQIVPAATFYPAEDYHQKYLLKRGRDFCH
eukprot:TRINITY_DN699_c0_g1_i1.p1 TRINITY_DN699_c0_g1~~TRINITY_DN699_c0_g1_i1.p1  ORF type:complete len:167 (+),score=27.31 TRINITY_DN699_c0_g1_i1:65-565(+)